MKQDKEFPITLQQMQKISETFETSWRMKRLPTGETRAKLN